MSFIVAVKGREGIVLAADSRQVWRRGEGLRYATWDGAEKLLTFPAPHTHVAAVLYGFDACGGKARWDHAWLAPIAEGLPDKRVSVYEYAEHVGRYFMAQAEGRPRGKFHMTGSVAGYDEDGEPRVYVVEVPSWPEPVEQHAGTVGMTWGGMREFVDRLISGFDARLGEVVRDVDAVLRDKGGDDLDLDRIQMQIPLQQLDLSECVDLATFLVRTTIDAQRFRGGLNGVGGGIDAVTVTAEDGLRVVQRAERPADMPVECRQISEEWPGAATESPEDIHRPATYTVAQPVPVE